MKALHIGAGNIGRGFIGMVLADNGAEVTFADVNAAVVNALKQQRRYVVNVVAETENAEVVVEGVDAVNSIEDQEKFDYLVARADIITTAVGPSLLPVIAESLHNGLAKRLAEARPAALNVIAAENIIGGSSRLRQEIQKSLQPEMLEALERYVGFPNSAVDRIVPTQQQDDPLTVNVEPFFEWVIDASAWQGPVPAWRGVVFVEDLEPFIERKLFTVNTGHAAVAYLGRRKGYATIAEAIHDKNIYHEVQEVLQETKEYLVRAYAIDADGQGAYTAKILKRFSNPALVDEVSRVGREPIRKLGESERFIKPLKALLHDGGETAALERVVAAVLHFDEPSDEQAVQLQQRLHEYGIGETLREYSGFGATDTEAISVGRIIGYYRE